MITTPRHTIDELEANSCTVSAHKYGFFLCRQGSARIMLGTRIYQLLPYTLVIYTPNTLFQILERSADLRGVLEEGDVSAYYPAISTISVQRRLQIRNRPCVTVSDTQAAAIERLAALLREEDACRDEKELEIHAGYITHLKYALSMKVLKAVKEKDAVINTLGIGGKGDGKPTTFVSRANKVIMRQMDIAQVRRYVVMSAIGAGDRWNFSNE